MKSERLWWLNQAEYVKRCGDKGSIQNSAGDIEKQPCETHDGEG